MSVGLSLQDDSRWQTLITHSYWEGFMVWTVVIDFVGELREGDAILALLVRLMLTFTLLLDLCQVMFKAFVFHISQLILTLYTIHTSLSWRMVA